MLCLVVDNNYIVKFDMYMRCEAFKLWKGFIQLLYLNFDFYGHLILVFGPLTIMNVKHLPWNLYILISKIISVKNHDTSRLVNKMLRIAHVFGDNKYLRLEFIFCFITIQLIASFVSINCVGNFTHESFNP